MKKEEANENSGSTDEEIKVDLRQKKNDFSDSPEEGIDESNIQSEKRLAYMRRKFVVGHGLANLGNTCYMNCIIQLLSHLYKFREELNTHVHNPKRIDEIRKKSRFEAEAALAIKAQGGSEEASTTAPDSAEKNSAPTEK